MDLRDLRALICISEAGTLSGAAQKVNLTQPGLSAMLRRLEGELEVQIVTRHSRGVVFTEEGRFLLEKAEQILRDVSEAATTVRKAGEEPVGEVRVGLPASVATGLVPALLPVVNERYPGIRLHLVEAMSGSLIELLQLGRLDLSVLFDIQPMPGLRSEPILFEEIRLLVAIDDPLATRSVLSLEEVANHPALVLPSREHSIRRLVERAAAMQGVALNVKADVDSMFGLVGLVRRGYATLLPTFLLLEEILAGNIRDVRISEPKIQWTVHLATRLDSVRPRAAMVVGRLLIEATTSLIRSNLWPGKVHPRQAR